MTYPQTLDYLYSRLPMFTRVGDIALKKDLHNTLALCNALDKPQDRFKSVHVGGTNGKGSTSHMLAAIFEQAGYKTGLYTSPHLKDFRERIRINGKMIPKSYVTGFVKRQQSLITQLEPSFFEVTVAMAFDFFAREEVDIAIIEVGLGGRLDSTNIIIPELSVITNISLDHTHILGDTLAAIATEKAGIIKKHIPVVIGEEQSETKQVFIQKAGLEEAPVTFASQNLEVRNYKRLSTSLMTDIYQDGQLLFKQLVLDLTGHYQFKNLLSVIQAILILRNGAYLIPDSAIYAALKQVKKLTGLQGRWQTLSKKPLVICDTGHNKAGISEVLLNIEATPHHRLHFVIGMVKDKDISGVLALLPSSATYYFCQPQLERALPVNELADKAAIFGLNGNCYPTVAEALQSAKLAALNTDLVFVGGSTFVVAEII